MKFYFNIDIRSVMCTVNYGVVPSAKNLFSSVGPNLKPRFISIPGGNCTGGRRSDTDLRDPRNWASLKLNTITVTRYDAFLELLSQPTHDHARLS